MELEVTKDKGLTLIELLVALAVFGLVILSMMGVANSVIKAQRKIFVSQNLQELGRYVLEAMSKEIRMGKITNSAGSTTLLNLTQVDGDGNGSNTDTVDYRFNSNRLQRQLNGGGWKNLNDPAKLKITGKFYIRESSIPYWKTVTIAMKITSVGSKPEQQADIYLQNTICPRGF